MHSQIFNAGTSHWVAFKTKDLSINDQNPSTHHREVKDVMSQQELKYSSFSAWVNGYKGLHRLNFASKKYKGSSFGDMNFSSINMLIYTIVHNLKSKIKWSYREL